MKIHSWNKGPIINEDAIVALNVPLIEVISIYIYLFIYFKLLLKRWLKLFLQMHEVLITHTFQSCLHLQLK